MPGDLKKRLAGWSGSRRTWISVCLVVLLVLLWPMFPWHRELPEFSRIDDIGERKAAFFEFLLPYIESANEEILRDRQRLERLRERLGSVSFNRRDLRWIRRTAGEYDLEFDSEDSVSTGDLDALLLRLDIIPPSLALAQAALESGWGTSRYARHGNNLFGIWCYTRGCGIVPRKRPAGATYEVASYSSPRNSFLAYIRNLNSNQAYESLWLLRRDLRQNSEPLEGTVLAEGLYRYSQEGLGYVSKVKGLIESNDLEAYDRRLATK